MPLFPGLFSPDEIGSIFLGENKKNLHVFLVIMFDVEVNAIISFPEKQREHLTLLLLFPAHQ